MPNEQRDARLRARWQRAAAHKPKRPKVDAPDKSIGAGDYASNAAPWAKAAAKGAGRLNYAFTRKGA